MICKSAEVGADWFACDPDVARMRRHLREIEMYAHYLPQCMEPRRTGGSERRAPGIAAAAPLNLDVVVALDPRSSLTVDREWDPAVDEDEPGRSIVQDLGSLSMLVVEESGRASRFDATLTGLIGHLLETLDYCARQPWVDEHGTTIRDLHRYAQTLAGDRAGQPLAPCLVVGCDAPVYWVYEVDKAPEDRRDGARCAGCGARYEGVDLLRLRTQVA